MNKKRAAVAILIVFIVAFVVFWLFMNRGFRVTNVSPALSGEIPTSTPRAVITFSSSLDTKKTKATLAQGDDIVGSTNITNNTITLYFRELEIDKDNIIELRDIYSADGEYIESIQYTFRSVYVPFGKLSEEQRQEQLETTDRPSSEPNVYRFLPYETSYYSISYGAKNDNQFVLYIDMKFSTTTTSGPSYGRYLEKVRTYRNQALSYLKESGLDINDYSLQYGEEVLRDEFPSGRDIEEPYTGDGVPPEEQP